MMLRFTFCVFACCFICSFFTPPPSQGAETEVPEIAACHANAAACHLKLENYDNVGGWPGIFKMFAERDQDNIDIQEIQSSFVTRAFSKTEFKVLF